MKRLLLLFLSMFLFGGTTSTMHQSDKKHSEAVAHFIIDEQPIYFADTGQYFLFARINGNSVGHVSYKFQDNGTVAKMSFLGICPSAVNQKIATALFKACISQARKRDAKYLIWDVMTLDPEITLQKLVEIYQKMIAKLNDENCKLEIGKPFGPCECQKITMTLKL